MAAGRQGSLNAASRQRIERYAAKHGMTFEEARRARQGTHGRIQDVERVGGRLLIQTKSAQRVRSEVTHAEAAGKRVHVTVRTKGGEWRTLEQNPRGQRGVSAKSLKQRMGKTAGNIKAWAARAYAESWADYDAGHGELEVNEIAEFQVAIYD